MTKKEYKVYLKTKYWKNFKRNYFSVFEKKCQKCGSKKFIHLHHKTYIRLGCELFTDVIALCEICHCNWHNKPIKRKRVGKPFSNILRKMKKRKTPITELHDNFGCRSCVENTEYLP